MGPEQARIVTLEERPRITPETVGGILPEAVAKSTGEREQDLAVALEAPLARALGVVVAQRPQVFVEIIAPTLGAAVRKAVAAALAAMMERFNEALERSLSLRSIRWRLEAARTERPFAEVVLLHTLVYRVEQVFLVHSETSLVLGHVIDEATPAQPPDQISAMLAAIDSFGREALSAPPEEHLDRFQIGEITVWVSHDATLTLAAVTRGDTPMTFLRALDEARERIHLTCALELGRFSGDVTPFVKARPPLEALLRTERAGPPRRAHLWIAAAAVLVLVALGVLGVRGKQARAQDLRTERAYVEALESEPGIIVSTAEWKAGQGRFTGFRDPLAATPEAALARHGLAPTTISLAPFLSADPRIEQRRAERVLAPPPQVSIRVERHELVVRGQAPRAWIGEARLLGRAVPGISKYDDSELRPEESVVGLARATKDMEAAFIGFRAGQWRVRPADATELRRIARSALGAVRFAEELHLGVCLEVIGHTDPVDARGDEGHRGLSARRAASVASELASLGVEPRHVRTRGAGAWDAPGSRARSVTFALRTARLPSRAGCGGAP